MATLERAREHSFMAGVGDVGMQLCEANVPFGLAKIHHVQEQLGVPADATFVGSPDATITRNNKRWSQGFGYGGVYSWSGDFAILDIKPNACGMLVGALPEMPELDAIRERLHALDGAGLELEGVSLDNDLTESNHFVDVLTVNEEKSSSPAPGGAKYVFVMHSSGHEHRGETARGPGLYFDQSASLAAMAKVYETPWGSLSILTGDDAAQWYRFYREVQDFNHRRRAVLAQFLFGEFDSMVNATHQGMVRGMTTANIGCYTFEDDDTTLFPLTLSPTLPAFLVEPTTNVAETAIQSLGWSERLERHNLGDRIRGTNLLPHGGGYLYPQLRGVSRVIEEGPDQRRFELLPANLDEAPVLIETPRDLDYVYRGMEVKDCMEELGFGRAVVHLDLDYVLKA